MPADDSSRPDDVPAKRFESRRPLPSPAGRAEGGSGRQKSRRRDQSSTEAEGTAIPLAKRVALACLCLLVCGVIASPVAAHAYLDETTPGNGERVEALPEELTLAFSGDGIQVAEVDVTGPNGDVVSGSAVVDGDDRGVVRVPLSATAEADGMYTVEWEILSDDGHTTDGSFFFTVGDAPSTATRSSARRDCCSSRSSPSSACR